MILGSTIFLIHGFALKLETCPSGPPREASEESTAHHLLTKIIQTYPRKDFWMIGGRSDIIVNCSLTVPKLHHLRTKFLEFWDLRSCF